MNVSAEESYSFGLGIGASYSGLGVNISQLSENDMKYISAGCISYSSASGETCGVGIGWIKTDLMETASNKHGLGAYLGIVGTKREVRSFSDFEDEPVYGIGVGYHYFFNGTNDSGTNLGFSLVAGDYEEKIESTIIFQVGYQF